VSAVATRPEPGGWPSKIRERLLGPSYFYHRRLIEQSKRWSPDEIRTYQRQRLQRLVEAYGHKVTHRDDYRANLSQYTRWDVPPLTHTVRTGGTSGQPLRFRADTFARRQKERAYLFDVWSQVGFAPYDRRVVFRGQCDGDLVRHERFENAWVVSPAAAEGQLDMLRRWVQTLPPFFLHVYPGSLYMFMDLLGEDLFRALPIRAVLAGSEGFPTGEQAAFEQEFAIPVAHWYGHSEYAALAYHCRRCWGFHFYPTYGYVDLPPADTDGLLRIVASSFNRVGTQFVRYDTGDLGVPSVGSCPDNHFPRVGSIVGRSQETFVDGAGRRRSLGCFVFGIHGPFWDQIRDLQFFQDRPGLLGVQIVTKTGADRHMIQQTLARRLPMVKVEYEFVPCIKRSSNGKRQYFLSADEWSLGSVGDVLQSSGRVGVPARRRA
jgi:phenylacetate-CoA ligase